MRTLDVGIDLDGVVYNFDGALRSWLIEEKGYLPERLPIPVATWDHWQTAWGLTYDVFMDECIESVDAGYIFKVGDPFPGAVEAIRRIHDAGHRIHILTARSFGKKSLHNTADWLDQWDIPFESACFSHHKGLFRPDIMVDDRDKNFYDLQNAGVLVYLQDRLWNQHVETGYRIKDLTEYADIIERMASS